MAAGELRGRTPQLRPRQQAHLEGLDEAGALVTADLAELFDVGRSTVYRALRRAEEDLSA